MAPKRKSDVLRPRTPRQAAPATREPVVGENEPIARQEDPEVESHVPESPPPERPLRLGEIQKRIRDEVQAEYAARNEALRKENMEMRQRLDALERAQAAQPVAPPPPAVRQEPAAPAPAAVIRINEGGVSTFEFLKLGLPKFKGEIDEDPRGFLEQVEKITRRLPCSEARIVELTGLLMEGQAWTWYRDHIEELLYVENPLSWEQFKRLVGEEFLSAGDREARMVQFERLRQGNMTVAEYASEFNRLSEFARILVPDEASKVSRFLRGLTTPLYSAVAAGEYITLTKLVDKAKRIESRLKSDQEYKQKRKSKAQRSQEKRSASEYQTQRPPLPPRQSSIVDESKASTRPTQSIGSPPQRTFPRCSHCGRFHEGECRRKLGACLKCGQQGHFIRDCPENKPQASQTRESQTTVQMNRPEGRGNGSKSRGPGSSSSVPQQPAGRGQGRIFTMTRREIDTEDPVNTEAEDVERN